MEQDKFNDIPGYSSRKAVEPISKGWSSDKKYRIITDLGEELLLRISSVEYLYYGISTVKNIIWRRF
ncbi:MAG: hypothetical protein KIG25_02360 [Eubacteriales bacterium]|nr:hypothetical protein [Eubacteriales bacterium]MDD7523897.1 hypothetical protein [Clostridiales bacterium]MDY4622485.1 hypothetical protein [Eubacteriales bacterium]